MDRSDTLGMITLIISLVITLSYSQSTPNETATNTNNNRPFERSEDEKTQAALAATIANIKSCEERNDDLRDACKYIRTKDCQATLKKCAEAEGTKREAKACAGIPKFDKDSAKDNLDDAKDDFEDSEEKLQDLQDKLQEAQEDALEKQQSTEEKITQLQNEINEIPNRATELALKNEAERDKLLLTHIDNMNAVTDDIQSITDALHDAETTLINKRNELLSQCELEARTKQQAKINEKNQKKAAGKNTVASLSDALQSTYTTKKDGKKMLRNTKEIIARYERCQKTRLFQTGVQAAERVYQRTLIALESRRKSIEKKTRSLEARLEASLKLNNKTTELEMASLAREQASKSQQVLMLQKQIMENRQQAEANIQKIQQAIQKAQMNQFQKQQDLFGAIQTNAEATKSGVKDEDALESIAAAKAYYRSKDNEDFGSSRLKELCKEALKQPTSK
ncbi:MAG: hypothetical protein KDD37_11000 [Bdellovibrionales bacterium]|nr:hypothetical protein [Bdellovibrionales bacterium]